MKKPRSKEAYPVDIRRVNFELDLKVFEEYSLIFGTRKYGFAFVANAFPFWASETLSEIKKGQHGIKGEKAFQFAIFVDNLFNHGVTSRKRLENSLVLKESGRDDIQLTGTANDFYKRHFTKYQTGLRLVLTKFPSWYHETVGRIIGTYGNPEEWSYPFSFSGVPASSGLSFSPADHKLSTRTVFERACAEICHSGLDRQKTEVGSIRLSQNKRKWFEHNYSFYNTGILHATENYPKLMESFSAEAMDVFSIKELADICETLNSFTGQRKGVSSTGFLAERILRYAGKEALAVKVAKQSAGVRFFLEELTLLRLLVSQNIEEE